MRRKCCNPNCLNEALFQQIDSGRLFCSPECLKQYCADGAVTDNVHIHPMIYRLRILLVTAVEYLRILFT